MDVPIVIKDCESKEYKQVETFKYLGSMVNAKGGCKEDIIHWIKAARQKWKDILGMVCDKYMPVQIEGKI